MSTFVRPPLTVTSVTIDPPGMSATLHVTADAQAVGSFVLVATTAAGRSSALSTAANTLLILDGNADPDHDELSNRDELAHGTDPFNPDTDGDGFGDGMEVAVGSDPLNKNSTPLSVNLQMREASGTVVSVLNPTIPSTVVPQEVSGVAVSILNTGAPSGPAVSEAVGAVVSVENLAPP